MAIHDEDPFRAQSDGMAVASLISGIVAVVACGLGVIAGPIAVVLGIVSGRRSGFRVKQTVGIVTGAVGFLVSAGAVVALLFFLSGRDDETFIQPTPIPTMSEASAQPMTTADASGLPQLTEEGVAASGYPTAYAAYLDVYGVTTAFDGIYQGDAIETPCFSMDGEPWWVTQGEPEACAPSSELWWETSSGTAGEEISLFGSGAAGSAISFEVLTSTYLTDTFDSTDIEPVSAFVRDTLLPQSGATDIVEARTEIGGLPAVQFDCSIGGLAAYRLYVVMLPTPETLDDSTEAAGFIIHAYNEAEWVYPSDDVFARLENTLVWK